MTIIALQTQVVLLTGIVKPFEPFCRFINMNT